MANMRQRVRENKKSENYNNADGEYITIMIHRDIMNGTFSKKKVKIKIKVRTHGVDTIVRKFLPLLSFFQSSSFALIIKIFSITNKIMTQALIFEVSIFFTYRTLLLLTATAIGVKTFCCAAAVA
jgi:hypothetical protein